ncbi:aromatic amino acid transport family protein [Endozoicomonas numazuensis]|uniref:Aromatic amino acid permease n=1 Tax=Endozoicomonas numazuensis TaxID=1137799 RepID=A0A081NEW3_9GAMM|nr:aromatic amino acid transport family protein [Endozoicomonas numazuensis]KEQ16986.1 hypothetical protein GZ78_20410 [Endozoicomonas numazuensis]
MNSQTLGSSLLVAGTSIGAGMLALPLVSAATGIWSGLFLMMLMAGLACYGGLLIAEACRAVPEADNLHGVVGRLLGKSGQGIAILAMLFLYFSLSSAYISAGAGQLASASEQFGSALGFSQSAIVVAVFIAILVVVGTVVVDYANRMMFFLMIALLMFIMMLLLPEVEVDNLTLQPGEPSMLFAALPVLYTSFGYHCAVPTVVRYVKGNPRDFRRALVLGSALPFLVYALWQIATNGTLSSLLITNLQSSPDAVGQLILRIGEVSSYSGFNHLISVFTACALGTSFLGVAIGLFDYLAEVSHRSDTIMGRIQTVFLTLGLPLAVAVLFPGSFVTTLGYAAVALVILAVFIPVMLVWEARKKHLEEPYQVAGGNLLLVIMCLIGVAVILAQVGIVAGWLPALDS